MGITSTPRVSTLTNRGELTLTITAINVNGPNNSDFVQTNNCAACLLLEILPKGFSLIFRVSSRAPSCYFKVGANTVQCSVYAKSPLKAHSDSQIAPKNVVLIFLIIELG